MRHVFCLGLFMLCAVAACDSAPSGEASGTDSGGPGTSSAVSGTSTGAGGGSSDGGGTSAGGAPGTGGGGGSAVGSDHKIALSLSEFNCAVRASGQLACWGNNAYGTLGSAPNPGLSPVPAPVDIPGLDAVTSVAVGSRTVCAIQAGGVQCWGTNENGAVGDGTQVATITPKPVVGLGADVVDVALGGGASHDDVDVTGDEHDRACALKSDGTVHCWGWNGDGCIGDGSSDAFHATPVQVTGLPPVAKIAMGADFTCAVTQAGGVKCWGGDGYGELGDGPPAQGKHPTPVDVVGLGSGVTDISAHEFTACALLVAGDVKCWGFYLLGDPSAAAAPDAIAGLPPVAAVAVGFEHQCFLTDAGGLVCAGWNKYGEVGDGGVTTQSAPTQVVGMATGVAEVATGWYQTCARLQDGTTWCWGLNHYGELGIGSTTPEEVHTPVVTSL